MKAYAQASPVKTDRRDAKLIALALRAGLYRSVHVKSLETRKLRLAQIRAYDGLLRRLARGDGLCRPWQLFGFRTTTAGGNPR